MDVRDSYDSAAKAYAEHLASELTQKPLDRHLLNRFAEEMRGRGLVADVGCGPGHVANYLHEHGVTVLGIDLSPEMIGCARNLNPGLEFRVGDMRELDLSTGSLAGIVAFYSGAPVSLDFRFHRPNHVIEALQLAEFTVIEHVEREPYEGAEYPSRRCYLFARAA